MNTWNKIIKQSLLGLQSQSIIENNAGESNNAGSSNLLENNFLNEASIQWINRKSIAPIYLNSNVNPPKSPKEEYEYASAEFHKILNIAIGLNSHFLISTCFEKCAQNKKIIFPGMIAKLISIGGKKPEWRGIIFSILGKRGEWVIQQNKEWKDIFVFLNSEILATGTPGQKKEFFKNYRQNSNIDALNILKKEWHNISSNEKLILLQSLNVNLSADDEDFLKSLLNDKSVRVKKDAIELLKKIPGSEINKEISEKASQYIKISKYTTIDSESYNLKVIIPNEITDEFALWGLAETSPVSRFNDNEYFLYQMMALTPLEFWDSHFNLESSVILDLFFKYQDYRKFIHAFVDSCVLFKNKNWAEAILFFPEKIFQPTKEEELLFLLNPDLREKYIFKILNNTREYQLNDLLVNSCKHKWSKEFSIKIIEKLSDKIDYLTMNYIEYLPFIHESIVELKSFIICNNERKSRIVEEMSSLMKKYIELRERLKVIEV